MEKATLRQQKWEMQRRVRRKKKEERRLATDEMGTPGVKGEKEGKERKHSVMWRINSDIFAHFRALLHSHMSRLDADRRANHLEDT